MRDAEPPILHLPHPLREEETQLEMQRNLGHEQPVPPHWHHQEVCSMLKIALVANLPPPYRVPLYQKIAEIPGIGLHVIFCCRREPNRLWDLPPLDFDHTFLRERFMTVKGRYIHNNLDVISCLRRIAPDVVVTNGFNPTHLYAFAYALAKRLPHVPMTDGTDISEQALSALHRTVRRIVYAQSGAFVSSSQGGHRLYEDYGVAAERRFTSCLCVDNEAFAPKGHEIEQQFDFIFCGRFEPVKNPLFALEVAVDVAKRLHRKTRILFVGAGSLEPRVRQMAARHRSLVDAKFYGFATQAQLPLLYHSARIFLYPARWDRWGIVANEACAAGLPVIVSPNAGVAGELVLNKENGYVCELNADLWGERAALLLTQPELHRRFSERSRAVADNFTFDKAAAGLVAACRNALSARTGDKERNSTAMKPRVVIVERQLLEYRVAFYQRLRALLEQEGVDLQLLIGDGTPAEKKKKNETSLDWAIRIPTRYLLGERLCWQPFGAYARGADMVIVMHENKLIYNLWLLSFGRPRRLAFWGHGRNMQSQSPTGIKERFKRWTVNKVDWWFAYTESSAALINNAGFPSTYTTVVDNAIDTKEMSEFCKQVTAGDCRRMREKMQLGDGPVGVYLGSLYLEKRLGFLLDAAMRIREKVPGFQLLVVGAGPEQARIEQAALDHSWIHYLGPLQGQEKAKVLVLADVMLNPGLVGLGILDSFVSGTPMFTTDCGLHSPEISYMRSGYNGVMTGNDLDTYAQAVATALLKPGAIAALKSGALSTASRYTVENMANRICNGIIACLSAI